MTITVPRFLARYDAHVLPGVGTFLLTESLPTALNGRLYERVCPLIDGRRSCDDIVRELRDAVPAAEVYYALNVLEQRGYIEEARDAVPVDVAAFWQWQETAPREALARLDATPVRLVTLGDVDTGMAERAMLDAGLRLSPDADLVVALADDYRLPELADLDRQARDCGHRWALAKPVGILPWIGPFFDPDRPGCLHCLLDRVRMNYATDTYVEEQTRVTPRTSKAATPASQAVMANLAAVGLAQWVATGHSPLVGSVMSLSMTELTTQWHRLVYRPQCRYCGEQPYRQRTTKDADPVPIPLRSRVHCADGDGGHRTVTAEETLDRYGHLISPITGVVSHIRSVAQSDHPLIHAYSASHNWATHPDSLAFLRNSLRTQSGGKGTTDAQAKVGAMAEAFERYSGVFRGDEIRRRATFAEMEEAGHRPVLPNEVMLFSERQYARRAQINAEGNSFQMVPSPFDPELPADWSPMWVPSTGGFRWLPTGLLYYSYSKLAPHDTPNRLAFFADSNGCAAGNTLEEAALQAMLELVERDAVATWWYNRVRRPKVHLDDLGSAYLDDLRGWMDEQGRDLWVLDITNDIGIPTFAAVSALRRPRADGSDNLVVGFGTHLDPPLGIMRAVTEVNQFFASLFALGDDDLSKAFDKGAVDWWSTATLANKDYLVPADAPALRLSRYPALTSDDLLAETTTVVSMIESRGLEVLLLDQTRPDVGFPVVKALVPGMRHFWSRLGPGRLYDVPVELGWLPAPLREDDLNPTPVFF